MKIKREWGGARKGAGRPKGSKRSRKVKFLGLSMYEEEKRAIEAGAKADGVPATLFVVKASVEKTLL